MNQSNSLIPKTIDNISLWLTSISLTILIIISAYFGSKQDWYVNLPVKSKDNFWVLAGLWLIASALSYGSFYLIKDLDENIYGQSRLLPWFIIVSFLNLIWIVVYYIYENFGLALLTVGIIFIITFYIILFLYSMNKYASLLIIPLEILYGYLFYGILHLAGLNNIII